jgi:two-component system CheB/CheR fusion protein
VLGAGPLFYLSGWRRQRARMASFPIIGIGASAGGLEAISELLGGLPSASGMAFIVVQHLDPDHESLLSEILAKRTRIALTQARDGMRVEPDHIYVIPPAATLTLNDDCLRLTPRVVGPERFMPVDALFRSLANARRESAIGVVLSGADADGAHGLQVIKHSGGITFAQEPACARFPSMPRSAIETGCVDFVLRPDQIARELAHLAQHPYLRSISLPQAVTGEPAEAAAVGDEAGLRRILGWLRTAHGVDFTHYKRSTLRRRLARRMAFKRIDDLAEYAVLIEGDPSEAATLYQDFLIRVTEFFRDPEAFDALARRVFPSLCEGRSAKEPIRIWVPGCASGEEVYSLAIGIVEYLGDRHPGVGIQVFGTDLSEAAIERARDGMYLASVVQDVPKERLQRFFVKHDGAYRIAKSLRDLCVFARHDVTRDPPFSRLDLVSCRNLLIYLDAVAQRRVMQVFHYALRPHGYLMLGASESVGQASELFELSDKFHRIYARRASLPGAGPGRVPRATSVVARPAATAEAPAANLGEADSAQREADRLLLARFAPASLLLDDALNILEFRGETGPYLEHASGPPSLNLSRVARPELLVEIDPAIREARERGVEVRREALCVGDLRNISIEVIPLQWTGAERRYLVVFEDGSRPARGRHAHQEHASALPESEKDRRLAQSEREIASIRDYLKAVMEEHEVVKEELKSAHEEVLSANEEFQSTNEELETAKEELQSANEELTTTNEELRNRNRELAVVNAEIENARRTSERAREYADQIIETVREPMLVLDAEMTIVRANKAYYTAFNVRSDETEGLRFYEVGNRQWDRPRLREALDSVLKRSVDVSDLESDYDVPAIGRRTMSVSARRISGDAEREELILLAFEDVTERRELLDGLRETGRLKDEFLAMLAHELRNPLATIMHSVHVLPSSDEAVSAPKLMIERQAQNLVRLVDELLDVARISRGSIELQREPVDLAAIAREAAKAASHRAAELRHELTLALPDRPVLVDGDRIRLEQVISNLLENAVKYTDPGGRITLALTPDHGEAVLSVRDTGIGLAPEVLENVFDLFTQVDRSLSRTHGGLGLGLTLVRRVLALHGGSSVARSAGLGKGSEFIIRLPLLPEKANGLASDGSPDPKPAAPGERRQRVLVVDDNADASYSLGLLVRTWGHEVAVARSGPEALMLAKSFKPETALVDIGLSGMDGYELARLLRADPAHRGLQLVAVTGYGREEDRIAAKAAGFDVYLVKPAKVSELKRLLASAPCAGQAG